MRIAVRGAVVALVACTGCSLVEQTIEGKAMLTSPDDARGDAALTSPYDNAAITVCGACPIDGGGMTCFCTGITDPPVAADGAYSLEQDDTGPNAFTASAPSTLEGSVSFTVDGAGDVDAPTVTLTPLGGVTGTVTGLTDLAGVVVAVDGSSAIATTDAGGAFAITGVVSGTHTLTAFQPGSPLSAAAQATVAVPYMAAATVVMDFAAAE